VKHRKSVSIHTLAVVLAGVLAAGLRSPDAASADAIAPGGVLEKSNADAASDLLPAETVAHYRAGEYRNQVATWPERPVWEPTFAAEAERNATRFDVDDSGTIVERGSVKPARGIYALPFRIDPSDPRAGVKAMWNAYYALWRIASSHDVLAIDWVGRKGLERQVVLESNTLYYEGVPPELRPKENPLDLAAQQLATVTAPNDLAGTASLTWRFRAADKRDQSWTYVPALRRVRQVSPANRSDGFLGSDMSQDDGAIFDGKPEDFTWKLVGAREGLVLADPASLAGKVVQTVDPSGAIADTWSADQKITGYQDASWTGLPWAPIAPVLVRRKLWVIEAVPRDPYYLFARIELTLDQETFAGATSRKFDPGGMLLRSLTFLGYASQPVQSRGTHLVLPASSMGYIAAENIKAGRATIVGTIPTGRSVHERRVGLAADLFTLERLGSTGK
jgi:hypothetical protein